MAEFQCKFQGKEMKVTICIVIQPSKWPMSALAYSY